MSSFKQMDLDAYSAARRDEWERLALLGKSRRFSGAEADELIERYQSGATDYSAIKTTVGQSIQGDRLTIALGRARLRFTGASANVLGRVPEFFGAALPAALFRIRWIAVANAVAFVIIATVYGLWLGSHPRLLLNLGTPAQLHHYANAQFVGYYSAHPVASFGLQVWTNNAWIAAQTIALGITGVFPAYMVFSNAQNVGQSAAIMHQYGHFENFFLYIAPHGQLELYSIFTAAAAGMFLFWAWIAPGARTRSQAVAEDGRAFFTIVVGLLLSLLVSGTIEGAVTRQPWPWPVKIGIGTVALVGFLLYQWVLGRKAFRAGATGDLDEFEAGARNITGG